MKCVVVANDRGSADRRPYAYVKEDRIPLPFSTKELTEYKVQHIVLRVDPWMRLFSSSHAVGTMRYCEGRRRRSLVNARKPDIERSAPRLASWSVGPRPSPAFGGSSLLT